MKRNYVKPEIMFEDFSLSTNIAGNCEFKANLTDGVCGYEDERLLVVVFLGNISGCKATEQVDSAGAYNSICYHNPTTELNLFNS